MTPMVYVLIPAHNNRDEVLELLRCLHQQTYENIRIVLVDDGSTDNTEEEVRVSFPETTILKGDGNLWWTGANVMGVNYILPIAKPEDFVLLLNNDLIIQKSYIETLVKSSISHQRAITGSLLVDYDNPDFVESGVQLSSRLDLIVNRDREKILSADHDLNVDSLPGRGTLIPIEVFKKIGNFNRKRLPHYGADYEFTIRAKRAGFRLIVSNKAKVFAKLNITGLEADPEKKIISLKECFSLLFSRKSKTNAHDYLNYVWLCSEKNYKFINLFHAMKGIMMETVMKTLPAYPIKIFLDKSILVMRLLYNCYRSFYKFLFKEYPLRSSDIQKYGLNPNELSSKGIIFLCRFRNKNVYYYCLNTNKSTLSNLSQSERNKFFILKKHSLNYMHKFAIIHEKINILIRQENT